MRRIGTAADALERRRQRSRRYYQANAKYCTKLSAKWAKAHPELAKQYRDKGRIKRAADLIAEKWAFIDAYGGRCACCGEDRFELLTIDHVNNDGWQRRKDGEQKGAVLYKQLRLQGYPKGEYQLLCWNCNCAKGKYGYCPHIFEPVYGLSGC